jgi:ubiquinone/menaquinone biosynthesis C-methylase UbiE
VNHNIPTPETALQRKYRVRIATFLVGVFVCIILLDTLYKVINTINRLAVVESERDQWQRPSDVIAGLKLKEGSVVADVGSGAGYFALKLSRAVGTSGKVLAVDIRKLPLVFLLIRAFSRSQHNIRIRVGDPDDPHLPIGMVDAVLIANAYHEFADPELTLDHTSRSLRFGGRLVVLDRSLAASNSGEEQEPHHELPPEVVDGQLRQKGFEILERQDRFISCPSGDRWWLIVAQKPQE